MWSHGRRKGTRVDGSHGVAREWIGEPLRHPRGVQHGHRRGCAKGVQEAGAKVPPRQGPRRGRQARGGETVPGHRDRVRGTQRYREARGVRQAHATQRRSLRRRPRQHHPRRGAHRGDETRHDPLQEAVRVVRGGRHVVPAVHRTHARTERRVLPQLRRQRVQEAGGVRAL